MTNARSNSKARFRLVRVGAIAGAVLTTALATGIPTASAATLGGTATVESPSLAALSGTQASTTPFTLVLTPAQGAVAADCSGDTSTGGYNVYGFLIPAPSSPSGLTAEVQGVTWGANGYGSSYYPLVGSSGVWGPTNTAPTTGEVVNIPTSFTFEADQAAAVRANTSLLGSGTSATYEVGVACVLSGAATDYWFQTITFSSSNTDSNGFVWSTGSGSTGGQAPEITRSIVLPIAGFLLIGGAGVVARRRQRRPATILAD